MKNVYYSLRASYFMYYYFSNRKDFDLVLMKYIFFRALCNINYDTHVSTFGGSFCVAMKVIADRKLPLKKIQPEERRE